MTTITLTDTRRAALRMVADEKLEYSLSTGAWEPTEGYRLAAWTWLEEHGMIEPDYSAEPQGRVTQRVPVYITASGRAALDV